MSLVRRGCSEQFYRHDLLNDELEAASINFGPLKCKTQKTATTNHCLTARGNIFGLTVHIQLTQCNFNFIHFVKSEISKCCMIYKAHTAHIQKL